MDSGRYRILLLVDIVEFGLRATTWVSVWTKDSCIGKGSAASNVVGRLKQGCELSPFREKSQSWIANVAGFTCAPLKLSRHWALWEINPFSWERFIVLFVTCKAYDLEKWATNIYINEAATRHSYRSKLWLESTATFSKRPNGYWSNQICPYY